jgi:hypothetical protein
MHYEKPAMVIERYALTQSIAACVLKVGFSSGLCVLRDADTQKLFGMLNLAADNHFIPNGEGCINYPSEMEGENGICYHTLANAAFTSG